MRIISLIVSIILAGPFFAASDSAQSQPACVIEGTVYDISNQLITGFRVAIEDVTSGEVINLRADNRAHYAAQLPPGQYRVIMRKNAGYPIEYIHSAFTLAAGEKVSINFHPWPYAISDSIENGKWHEEYVGDLPVQTTQYIRRNDGAIKDLRIQSFEIKPQKNTTEYLYSVIASFDKFTLQADKVSLDKKGKLTAENHVIFQNGSQESRATKVTIDLRSTPPLVTVISR